MVARASKVETSPDFMAVFTTPIMDDPDVVAIQYHKDSWGKYYGSHFYQNEKVWDMIQKARFAADWNVRKKLYEQIQTMIMEDAPEIYGMLYNRRWAFRKPSRDTLSRRFGLRAKSIFIPSILKTNSLFVSRRCGREIASSL